jgi:hypothetical protein
VNPTAAVPGPRHPLVLPVLVRRTHDLLASGVPLTLLLDLADDAGPRSQDRYTAEGGDASWVAG